MNRLESMSAFVAVAELRGFTAAAQRLGWSASAVTRAVAALEEHLSIRLFHRTTRSVSLTDAGGRFLERARQILQAVAEAESEARAEHSAPTGRLVVAAPKVFGRREVAPLLSEYLLRHPAVVGHLTLADRLVSLVEEDVDIAVRIGALDDSSLRVRSVGATRRVLVASPAFLRAQRRIRRPSDLRDLPTIQFVALSAQPEWRFLRGGAEQRVPLRPSLVTDDAEAAVAHAARGGGVAMVLSYQVAAEVRRGELEILLRSYEPPPLPIQLVYSGARFTSANVRSFIDLVVERGDWSFVDLGAPAAKAAARRHAR